MKCKITNYKVFAPQYPLDIISFMFRTFSLSCSRTALYDKHGFKHSS